MAANEAAIEMRRSARQREVEEVESILAYQAMKVGKRWGDEATDGFLEYRKNTQ